MLWVVCSIPADFIFPLFLPEKKKRNHYVFASVSTAAGEVNGYDSLILSKTTVVRGKGRVPEIPVTKSGTVK